MSMFLQNFRTNFISIFLSLPFSILESLLWEISKRLTNCSCDTFFSSLNFLILNPMSKFSTIYISFDENKFNK